MPLTLNTVTRDKLVVGREYLVVYPVKEIRDGCGICKHVQATWYGNRFIYEDTRNSVRIDLDADVTVYEIATYAVKVTNMGQ